MVEKKPAAALGMVGRCFIVWAADGQWKHQGIIRGEPAPGMYLTQYFSALDGSPTDLTIIPLERFISKPYREPGSYMLFEDDEALRFWIEHRYRAPAAK